MTKRILAFVTVLAMLLSVLPVMAVSAEVSDETLTRHTHSDAHSCSEQCGGSVVWTAWEADNSLPADSGHYYLTKDVQLTANNDVAAGKDITVCLNGYNIRSKANTKVSFVYGKLTVADCTAYEQDGTYISGTVVGSTSGDGAVFGVRRGGTFVLEGGRVTGGTTTGTGGGGVIYTQGGTSAGAGGMVYIYGGEIFGNEGYNGGAICLGGGSASYTPSAMYMYGGKIYDNYGRNHGGAVYVVDWSTVEIHGGQITGSTTKGKGPAIYMAGANSALTVSGDTKLDGVYFASASNKGLLVNGLTEDASIDVTTTATDFSKVISIAQGGKQETWDPHWVTANGESVSMVDGAFKGGHYHGSIKYEPWTGSDSHNTLPTGAKNYYLVNDIVRNTNGGTVGIAAGVTQRMCLNGHTITHRNPAGRLYNIQGTFVLEDCTAKTEDGKYISGGITYAGATPSTRTYGSCFSVQRGGTMTMEAGQIYGFTSDCKDYEDSVPVYIQGATAGSKATFLMNGGEIHSNSSKSLGAAIKLTRNGTPDTANPSVLQLNGGKIWGNTSLTGGAVAATGDSLIITGGEISGNTCVNGAVQVLDQCRVSISGVPVIADNQGGNLFLDGDLVMDVGTLEESARIYVSVSKCDRAISGTVDAAALKNFFCDSTYRMLLIKEDKLYIEVSDEHPHCLCYGKTQGCNHETVKWQAWESTTSLPTASGHYYLLSDVNLAVRASISGEVYICLNGKTVTAPENNRHILIYAGSALSISDCQGGGKLTGGNNTYGGSVNVNRMGTFNLYGGTIIGNRSRPEGGDGLGGAVYIQAGKAGEAGGIFNFYGGTITGNEAYAGGAVHLAAGEEEPSQAGQVNIFGGTISGNKAGTTAVNAEGKTITYGGSGAAVYVGKYGQILMQDGTITENKGLSYGGTIYLNGAAGQFTGGKITGNTSQKDGGGLYAVSSSEVQIGGTIQISDNKVSSGAGGGFGAAGKSQIKMTGGTVSGNYAVQGGGAIIQSGATMSLEGGTFQGNESKYYGGAIYVNVPNADGTLSVLYIRGGTITGNTSGNAAGGVYCKQGYLEMTGGKVSGNETKNYGCGLYCWNATGKFIGGTISGNISGKDGGGLYIYGGTAEIGGNVVITGNISQKGAGGGIGFTKECKATMYGGTITGNKAPNAGGIIVQGKAHLVMTGGSVTGNEATSSGGGGVYVNSASADIRGAARIQNNTATRYGGGIYSNTSTVTITGVTVSGNYAKSGSGGMHALKGAVTIKDAVFAENSTDVAAGGLCATKDCQLLIENSVFEKNTANNAGGVLLQNWAKATLNNCIIRENKTAEGSGLYVYSDVEATVNGGRITDNIAHTKLDKNGKTVGGIGAGVYLHTATATRTGRSVLQLNDVEISGNTAERDGGGVYVDKQMVCYLKGCTVQNNTAGGMGAGIFQNTGCVLTVKDSKILANQGGDQGSGIYAGSDFTLENTVITGNKTENGAAVYIGPARYDGHSYVNATLKFGGDLQIEGNEGTMDDLYIDQGAAIGVTAEGFGQNTNIKVQMHSGVLTNTILGKYDYEGGDLHYVLTYGDRSLTEPEFVAAAEPAALQEQKAGGGDILLYAGIGVIGLAAIAAVVLLLLKKKKSPAGEGK